jgi:hypothetical protein
MACVRGPPGKRQEQVRKKLWILLALWFGAYVAALELLRPQFSLIQISAAAAFIIPFLLVVGLKKPS